MATRATFFALALAAGVVASYFLVDRDAAPAAPVVAAVTPSEPAPVVAEIDAGQEKPLPSVNFAAGFCSTTGGERFAIRYTLYRLIADFVNQPQPGNEELVALLRRGVLTQDQKARDVIASELSSRWPDSVQAQAFLAQQLEGAPRLAALRRARALDPRDPALGWAIAEATWDSGELDEAIDGLTAYLAKEDVQGISRKRARLEVARSIEQGYQRATRNGVTILWPAPTITNPQAWDLAGMVDRELDAAAEFTATKRREALTVIVYPTRSELMAVSCAPTWAGGLYDGVLRLLAAPTPEGVKLSTVKHETLHAQLTPLTPNSPRWFDEGMAMAFERRPDPQAWKVMVQNKTWIPFSSLNEGFTEFEGPDVGLAYAQSYAMVEMMRECGGGSQAFTIAREAIASGADASAMLARVCGREVTGADLLAFLAKRVKE